MVLRGKAVEVHRRLDAQAGVVPGGGPDAARGFDGPASFV